MILQTQQKKLRLDSLTEQQSPFRETKTMKIFKNTANLTLRGQTYDAKHLESFLASEYCNKPQSTIFNQTQERVINSTKVGSNPRKTQSINGYSVRPSVAFLSMTREEQKQTTYVDLYDGPSSLQKRDNIPTMKEKTQQKTMYDVEKEEHLAQIEPSMNSLKQAQEKLQTQNVYLVSPRERRQEFKDIKYKIDEYQNVKTAHQFYGKRDRILKGGWRHGILGVEDVDTTNTSSYYQDQNQQKLTEMKNKEIINKYRRKKLALQVGTTYQIEVGSDEIKRQSSVNKREDTVVQIADQWKSKGRSQRFHSLNTFERIFLPSESRDPQNRYIGKVSLDRTMKLRDEEQKGRQFNIINGQSEGVEKWIGAFKEQTANNNKAEIRDHWKDKLQL